MKKLVLFVAFVAAITFASCTGKTEPVTTEPAPEVTPATEQAAPEVAPATTPDTIVAPAVEAAPTAK